jgi:hypothetical protein
MAGEVRHRHRAAVGTGRGHGHVGHVETTGAAHAKVGGVDHLAGGAGAREMPDQPKVMRRVGKNAYNRGWKYIKENYNFGVLEIVSGYCRPTWHARLVMEQIALHRKYIGVDGLKLGSEVWFARFGLRKQRRGI